jgi:tRNA/rRNA methyltransferase
MPAPIIVLVEPQLGENIGMCARAMLNCGLSQLRLVRPREGWPNDKARATAADADPVLNSVQVHESVEAAVADCHRVFATTARRRDLNLPVLDVDQAVAELPPADGAQTTAVLFGPEASGLDNAALRSADRLLTFPMNPDFSSLNLAQAVLLFSWEWRKSVLKGADEPSTPGASIAPKDELAGFLGRLERELDAGGFFTSPDRREDTLSQLASLFHRATPADAELRMLHGVITALKK